MSIKQEFYLKEESYLLRINEITKLYQELVNQKNMQFDRYINTNNYV